MKNHKYKLSPSARIIAVFEAWLAICCELYNVALAGISVAYPDLPLVLYATGFSDYYLPKLPTPRMVLAIKQWNKNIGGSFYAQQVDF